MKAVGDMTGQVYGKLTVISKVPSDGKSKLWLCKCECGKTKVVKQENLRTGATRSCGCLMGQCTPPIIIKHNGSRTKLYKVWQEMKYRCNRKDHKFYGYYGARGIQVCEEWFKDFGKFQEWSSVNGYVENAGLEIDRVDNDKGYSPENCRWISHAMNLQNTRRKLVCEIDGKEITLKELSKQLNVTYNKLYCRYKKGLRGSELIA